MSRVHSHLTETSINILVYNLFINTNEIIIVIMNNTFIILNRVYRLVIMKIKRENAERENKGKLFDLPNVLK